MISLLGLLHLNTVQPTTVAPPVDSIGIVQKVGPSKHLKPIEAPEREQVEELPIITATALAPPVAAPMASSEGNTYTPGNCTWGVKQYKRPDLPNMLGNANQWLYNARAMGLPTGSEPRAGAVGVQRFGTHVVYIEAVNDDGTVSVWEMNYNGLYSINTDNYPASYYDYIY